MLSYADFEPSIILDDNTEISIGDTSDAEDLKEVVGDRKIISYHNFIEDPVPYDFNNIYEMYEIGQLPYHEELIRYALTLTYDKTPNNIETILDNGISGTYESEIEFTRQRFIDDFGNGIYDALRCYIDWDQYFKDLDVTLIQCDNQVVEWNDF